MSLAPGAYAEGTVVALMVYQPDKVPVTDISGETVTDSTGEIVYEDTETTTGIVIE